MATLKPKDIRNMSKEDREKKLKELKLELVKSRTSASKTGSSRIKDIKKIIARIITINKSESKPEELKKK
jgi:large subunit ribosomal protein L29